MSHISCLYGPAGKKVKRQVIPDLPFKTDLVLGLVPHYSETLVADLGGELWCEAFGSRITYPNWLIVAPPPEPQILSCTLTSPIFSTWGMIDHLTRGGDKSRLFVLGPIVAKAWALRCRSIVFVN